MSRLIGSEADTAVTGRTTDPSGERPSDQQQAEVAYRAALDTAVRCLSRREYAHQELVARLLGKGHERVLVERVMAYLLEHDLQSDERYVESFVHSRIRKGYGPVKIRQELGRRGVDECTMKDGLTESSEFWINLAETAIGKKYGPDTESGRSREDWNTRARFLARRGFPSDLIYRVLGSRQGF